MAGSHRRLPWLPVRLVVYLLVVAALLLARSARDWHLPFGGKASSLDVRGPLSIWGVDLAPELIRDLATDYEGEYPGQDVLLQGGGTYHALEALINAKAQVAFLTRPPSREEQDLVRAAAKDSVLWFPVGLGGIVLFRAAAAETPPVSLASLRAFLRGDSGGDFERLYAPDPNLGVWDAFTQSLGISMIVEPRPDRVIFVESDSAVVAAVRADPLGIGLGSSLTLPRDLPGQGVKTVAVYPDSGAGPVLPGDQSIGYGEYPLHHYLYASCLANSGLNTSMFLTYLTSDRGQRHVERAGVLPARQVLRPIYLTKNPIGSPG